MRSILMVTDDTRYAAAAHGDLTDAGFFVVHFDSLEETEAFACSIRPDLVIADLRLGFESVVRLSSIAGGAPRKDATPVVVISDCDDALLTTRLISQGFTGIIPREARGAELLERLELLTGAIAANGNSIPLEAERAYSFSRDRDWFDSMGLVEWGYSRQNKTPMALIILAMRDVEALIEEHGPEAIDSAMKTVEVITRAEISSRDTFARYGRGMIGIVLAETALREARLLGWSLREILADTEFGNVARSLRPSFVTGITSQEAGELKGWTEMKDAALTMANNGDGDQIGWEDFKRAAVERSEREKRETRGHRAA